MRIYANFFTLAISCLFALSFIIELPNWIKKVRLHIPKMKKDKCLLLYSKIAIKD